jgi:hypothetical protein
MGLETTSPERKGAGFAGLPQATTGDGDTVQAIPDWNGRSRAAFLVDNGHGGEPGPRQLIEFVGR